MNTQTTELLSKLAQKLGTTSEYLWHVLLHQAVISAWIGIIQVLILAGAIICFLRFHKKFSTPGLYEEKSWYDDTKSKFVSIYEGSEWIGVVMAIIGIILSSLCIVTCFNINNIINGFFDPEYWALDKILDCLKK
jgi:hypothetical protein